MASCGWNHLGSLPREAEVHCYTFRVGFVWAKIGEGVLDKETESKGAGAEELVQMHQGCGRAPLSDLDAYIPRLNPDAWLLGMSSETQ